MGVCPVVDPGEGPGGSGPTALIFPPKWGPKGRKKKFLETAPRVLCFFIVSFKRCYDEYLLGFLFTFCWSFNILMSFSPPKRDCNATITLSVAMWGFYPLYRRCLFKAPTSIIPISICWFTWPLQIDKRLVGAVIAEENEHQTPSNYLTGNRGDIFFLKTGSKTNGYQNSTGMVIANIYSTFRH